MANQFGPRRDPIIPIGPSIAYVPLTRGAYALIDREDAERLLGTRWVAWTDNDVTYAQRTLCVGGKRTTITLQHFLAGAPGLLVDHANCKPLDNRRINLRSATSSQNAHNRGRSKNNTSGYKGVTRKGDGWAAQIMHNKQRVWIGTFVSPEEAHAAYRSEAARLHGHFAHF